MFKIAIVEDSQPAWERLRTFLERFEGENEEQFEITVFTDAVRFLSSFRQMYDLVFMDIDLPGLDGMDAARRLRTIDSKVELVFVTNMAQYAVNGYEVDAAFYLVKPVHYGDFELKLKKILARRQGEDDTVVVARQSGFVRIALREIRYIEVQGHTLVFHMETGEISGTGTLQKMEEKLAGKGFLRCNKCYLVNQRHIIAVEGYTLKMSGGDELQISRPRKKPFMTALADLMGNENIL